MRIDDLEPKLKEKLLAQQNEIINASEEKIVVFARPGSGKTYTLVKRVSKELEGLPDYKGIIACSFTKEASRQLKDKIETHSDIKASVISTLDSFVVDGFILRYKNRIIKNVFHSATVPEKFVLQLTARQDEAEEITKDGECANALRMKAYKKKWGESFCKGICHVSFPIYQLAEYMLDNVPSVSNFYSKRFTSIYVDEAQDLNFFQISFLLKLIEKCKLKAVFVGDKNQSIYEFRGARPELFYNLIHKGFQPYNIDVSLRCDPSIAFFANLFLKDADDLKDLSFNKQHVFYVSSFDFSKLRDKPFNFFILTETNAYNEQCYLECKKYGIDVTLAKKIKLDNEEYEKSYLSILEEIISFYLNFRNDDLKQRYSFDDFMVFLENYRIGIKEKDIYFDSNVTLEEYLTRICKLIGVPIDYSSFKSVLDQLSHDEVTNYYFRKSKQNRIMTFHSSKGLEAEYVIVYFTKLRRDSSDANVRSAYVAFTRAEKNLIVVVPDEISGSFYDVFYNNYLEYKKRLTSAS